MARSRRSSKLESGHSRSKLRRGTREFVTIGRGLALGYRRTAAHYGTWQGRVWHGGRYHYRGLGVADDQQEANDKDVRDYFQAQGVARLFFEEVTKGRTIGDRNATVATTAERYLAWYKEHRKAYRETKHSVDVHILPFLGSMLLSDLTAPFIRKWHEKLAEKPARVRSGRSKKQSYRSLPESQDGKRARRSTANRVLTVLKAMLNRAFQDGIAPDDSAWRKVKPFANADEARIRFLTDAEATRLVNASDAKLRQLIRAALLTGARYGELVQMRAHDVNVPESRVHIAPAKSGKRRHVPLNPEGAALFATLTKDKAADQLVFTKENGTAWGKNHSVRGIFEACRVAKIQPGISFHELRHTYASHLAQAGVDVLTISKLLGHSDTRVTSKHYAHLADKTLADAVVKLPSFAPSSTAS